MAGQIIVRGQGQTKCVHHKGKILKWFCETCDDAICAKCVSTYHKGHDNILLNDATPGNKRKIKTFISEIEHNELIQIQQEINSTQDCLNKHLSHFESVAEEVKKQGVTLKDELDVLIAQTLSQLKLLEDENTQLLTSYKTELERKLSELKKQLQMCKKILQTATDIQVFDTSSQLNTNVTLPGKPVLGTAEFIPNKSSNEIMEKALGKVTMEQPQESQDQPKRQHSSCPGPGLSHRTSTQHIREATEQEPSTIDEITYQLMSMLQAPINVLSEWESPLCITSICSASHDGVWACDLSSRTVKHITSQGELQQEIQCPVSCKDICISLTTNNLWACSDQDSSVMELTPGRLITKFKTKDTPLCLCVTRDNHVLVGMKNRIAKYTFGGKSGQTTYWSWFWKSLVRSPCRMSQCPVSENVAVVDMDRSEDGGKDEPLIIVIDKHLQEVLRYGQHHHIIRPGTKPFDPKDLTYDSLGRLVIADHDNKSLYRCNDDGFVHLLHTDIDRPLTACVDSEGVLWVGFEIQTYFSRVTRIQCPSFF